MSNSQNADIVFLLPCLDGRIQIETAMSIANTVKELEKGGIRNHIVSVAYDAMIERARNDLLYYFMLSGGKCAMWIDSDISFVTEDVLAVYHAALNCDGAVSGIYRRKSDVRSFPFQGVDSKQTVEASVEHSFEFKPSTPVLPILHGGFGFMCMSRNTMHHLKQSSDTYTENGVTKHRGFHVNVVDGLLYSEDVVACHKIASRRDDGKQDYSHKLWLATDVHVVHHGHKAYAI